MGKTVGDLLTEQRLGLLDQPVPRDPNYTYGSILPFRKPKSGGPAEWGLTYSDTVKSLLDAFTAPKRAYAGQPMRPDDAMNFALANIAAATSAGGPPKGAVGSNSMNFGGGQMSGQSRKLTQQELQQGIEYAKRIQELAKEHGKLYIRWSPTAKRDLLPDSVSRDFVSGNFHNGLSAIEIDPSKSPAEIASALAEYSGTSRLSDPRSLPRIYSGARVGTDTDGYALIRPKALVEDVPKSIVSSLDKKLVDAIKLHQSIAETEATLPRLTDQFAIRIVSDGLKKSKQQLYGILDSGFN